jgi:hypothetical protein
MRRIGVGVATVVAVVAIAGCDWAQLGFGPDRTSFNPSEPAITPTSVTHLNTAWSALCNCLTPPLVANGLVHTADPGLDDAPRDVTIAARERDSGAVRWSVVFRQISDARFIGVANGLAYVRVGSLPLDGASDTSDLVLALDATTRKLRWFLQPPDPSDLQNTVVSISSWLVDGPRLFLVTASAGHGYSVSAYDTAGHPLWNTSAPGTVDGIVADPGRTLHAVSFVPLHPDGTGTEVLTSYAESSGAVSAQRLSDFGPLGLEFPYPMSFANGVIYARSNANGASGNHVRAVAVGIGTGVQLWNALDEAVEAVAPGAVITLGVGVTARDPLTGAILRRRAGATVAGEQSAAVAGGVVFAAQTGALALQLPDGNVLSTPSGVELIGVANGRIVVAGFGSVEVLTPAG